MSARLRHFQMQSTFSSPASLIQVELARHVAEDVGGVVPGAHLVPPLVVQRLRRAGDDLEVGEHASRSQQTCDLGVQPALSFVGDVMHRE